MPANSKMSEIKLPVSLMSLFWASTVCWYVIREGNTFSDVSPEP